MGIVWKRAAPIGTHHAPRCKRRVTRAEPSGCALPCPIIRLRPRGIALFAELALELQHRRVQAIDAYVHAPNRMNKQRLWDTRPNSALRSDRFDLCSAVDARAPQIQQLSMQCLERAYAQGRNCRIWFEPHASTEVCITLSARNRGGQNETRLQGPRHVANVPAFVRHRLRNIRFVRRLICAREHRPPGKMLNNQRGLVVAGPGLEPGTYGL